MPSTPATLRIDDDLTRRRHAEALSNLLDGQARFDLHNRMLYATDASIYQVEPIGVVIPASIEDAEKALAYCREHGLPVLPRGGGTSLAGQCTSHAVVIDFSARCTNLEWVSPDTRACHVQPGITIDDLNDQLRAGGAGLFFAPDPATARQCNIGGAIGNNAAGTRSILYGRTSENIEAIDVLLSTGERATLARGSALATGDDLNIPDTVRARLHQQAAIARRLTQGVIDIVQRYEPLIRERFPKTLRRNAGYQLDMILADIDEARAAGKDPLETVNLANLICGSEGTLAITTSATLKLHPVPRAKGLAVIGFDSLEAAIDAVIPMLSLQPSAVELLDDMVIGLARDNFEYQQYVKLMPAPKEGRLEAVLYVEFYLPTPLPLHPTPTADNLPLPLGGGRGEGHPERTHLAAPNPSPSGGWGEDSLTLQREAGEGASPPEVAIGQDHPPPPSTTTYESELETRFTQLRTLIAARFPTASVATYTGPAEMAQALKLRKAGEPLLHGIPGARKPLGFVEDNAVPVENLAEFVRAFRAIVARHGTRAAFWAHASVGVLHVRPLLDPRDPADREHMEQIAVEVADLARSLGGVMSGEHGDGRARGPLLERFYGPELMRAFREVKQLFDPLNLLNPGNIVSPEPIESIHENLRVRPHGANTNHPDVETYFDYSHEEGFDHAVELCNGSGVCRKKQGGTMCPSYMATLDERHSTRGRGNALRLAITGQLKTPPPLGRGLGGGTPQTPDSASPAPNPNWTDPETLATLNLCLSCKACKTECPTNVDIAQYKAEYLAQGYKATGKIPLKARVFGNIRTLNRLGSAFAPLSNWAAELPPSRWIANRLLGLAPQRSLPKFARSLKRQLRTPPPLPGVGREQGGGTPVASDAPLILLYADCFTTYNDPHIGLATIRVLNAFGYRVELADEGCCQRAAISTGLLDRACKSGFDAYAGLKLEIEIRKPSAVIVCEPSCLSAIKDEWAKLKFGRNFRAATSHTHGVGPSDSVSAGDGVDSRVLNLCFLPEDFLDKHWDSHPRRPAFKAPRGVVALHAHCHQKALWGAETSARLLHRIAPDHFRALDTGCCGMAGSFGYTADRYDLSMGIGELALFPAVRKLGPDDTIVAPGTSCRHQIHDGTKRTALHPIELIAQLLDEPQRHREHRD